jgi:UDP-N-acetylglucosamine/UDP-N-acetyl-alpha-D-glucosaminouronate 4-epimerase
VTAAVASTSGSGSGSGERCLVTGGAGFIGSNLVRALLERGFAVRVLDNLSTGSPSNIADLLDDVEFLEGSVAHLATVSRACEGVSRVFHEAAIPSVARSVAAPLASHESNATGTLNVLIAAQQAGVDRVVYASSSSVYGDAESFPVRESFRTMPISPYAVSKLAGEQYLAAFHASFGLPTVALRYFNVFGPRQDPGSEYAAVVPRFATAALAGAPVTIYGDGEQSRDFTFVADVVQANLLAAEAPEEAFGRAFNVAYDQRHSVNELLREIRALVPDVSQPEPEHAPARAGEIRDSQADVSAAREVLGYSPEFTFLEGLRQTVEWFRTETAAQA